MSDKVIDCYVINNQSTPILLPKECIADIVAKPKIQYLENKKAAWMYGHLIWEELKIPVMLFSALCDSESALQKTRSEKAVVLNPIRGATRKIHACLLTSGAVKTIAVNETATVAELPSRFDKRYVEQAVDIDGQIYIIPNLSALSVALSYF